MSFKNNTGIGYYQGRSPREPPIEMLFQIFRLNFSWNMPKMHYFSCKFSKIANHSQHPLTFSIGVMKFRDLAKLWFFKLIMTKSNFKNIVDVISGTSSPLRHRKSHQNNVINFFQFRLPPPSKFLATPVV